MNLGHLRLPQGGCIGSRGASMEVLHRITAASRFSGYNLLVREHVKLKGAIFRLEKTACTGPLRIDSRIVDLVQCLLSKLHCQAQFLTLRDCLIEGNCTIEGSSPIVRLENTVVRGNFILGSNNTKLILDSQSVIKGLIIGELSNTSLLS